MYQKWSFSETFLNFFRNCNALGASFFCAMFSDSGGFFWAIKNSFLTFFQFVHLFISFVFIIVFSAFWHFFSSILHLFLVLVMILWTRLFVNLTDDFHTLCQKYNVSLNCFTLSQNPGITFSPAFPAFWKGRAVSSAVCTASIISRANQLTASMWSSLLQWVSWHSNSWVGNMRAPSSVEVTSSLSYMHVKSTEKYFHAHGTCSPHFLSQ